MANDKHADTIMKSVQRLSEVLDSTVKSLSERMEAVEKQAAEMQKYWEKVQLLERPESLDRVQDLRMLFMEKGIDGLQEALLRPTQDERLKTMQQLAGDFWITHQLLSSAAVIQGRPYNYRELKTYKRFQSYLDESGIKEALGFKKGEPIIVPVTKGYEEIAKTSTLYTGGSGLGAEWVPTGWSSEMQEFYRLRSAIADMFGEVPMPQSPYTLPIQSGRVTIYNASEATDDTAIATGTITSSTIGTGNTTFTAKKPSGRVLWSGELNEDSIIPMLDTLRRELPEAIADAVEDAIINGDTSTTHMDSDVTSSTDHRKMWIGLRKHANSQSAEYDVTTGSTSFAYDDFGQARLLMGRYAGLKNPAGEFFWVGSLKAYILAMAFTELKSQNFVGAGNSVIPRGAINVIDGSPVFVSEFVRQNLNASGVYDGTTTSYTEFLGCFRPGWKIGTRRQETIELFRIGRTDQYEIIIMKRMDFQPMYSPSSGEALSCSLIAIS